MDKNFFSNLSKQYGSLIGWLIESNSIYLTIDIKIRWCFAWDENTSITGAVNRNTNIMSVNVLFVDEAYKDNRIFDIEYFLLHELRHIYQHNQIERYKKSEYSVDPIYIEKWMIEGSNYIKALDEKGNENIEYYKQDCELDAYAFSYAIMKYKYKGIYDDKLFIPKIYRNELKKDFDSAVDDFLKNIL